ncbi:MAG: TonB-dependent receptor plug domain-containing protein [Methylococcales bacterium]
MQFLVDGNLPVPLRLQIRPHLAVALFIGCTAVSFAKDKPTQLKDMVVSASLVPVPIDQTGTAVTVITAQQIKQQQVVYVSDILRNVPGLAVNRGGSFGSFTQVRIRGTESRHTLVRIDGIEINDPSSAVGSEFDFGNLLAVDIERIEILRGPQSALYGSDAIGGVINIFTKKGEKGLSPKLTTEGGSFDTYRVGASLSGGTGNRFDFYGSANYLSTEGISTADVSNGNRERDANRNLTAHINTNFRPLDYLEFGLTGRLVQTDLDLDDFGTPPNDPMSNAIEFDANNKTRSNQYYGRMFGKLTLFDDIDWLDWEHIVSAAYSENKRDDFNSGNYFSTFDGAKNQYYYQSNLLIDTPDLAESHHTLTFKLEHERDKINASIPSLAKFHVGVNDRRVTTISTIGEYQLAMFERLSLSGSIRHDNNDNLFKDQTTYRSTFSYLLKETASRMHASWGTGVKNPTLFELFGFTTNFNGNPNLISETSRGWDAGLAQNFFGERLSLDVTYFRNRIANLIVGSGRTAINLAGENPIEGLEFGLTAKLIENLEFNGNYTWTSAKDAKGNPLVRRPKHIASANLNYGFRLFGKPANVNVGLVYNGKQTDFKFDQNFNSSNVSLGDYTLLNIALSYRIVEELELFARVQNALDKNYQEVFTFGSPGIAVYGGFRLAGGPFFD